MPRVFLVRHGETDANRSGVIQGQSGKASLTDPGRLQMELAATHLKGLLEGNPKIWHSTQERVSVSASIFQATTAGNVQPAPELVQRSWGSVEGRRIAEVARAGTEQAYYAEPGQAIDFAAEKLESIRDRLQKFTAELLRAQEPDHIVLSHNELINYLLNLWTGEWLRKRSVENGEIITVILDSEGRVCAQPRSIFPKREVCVWHDAPSFMRLDSGLNLLAEHDLVAMSQDRVVAPGNVVAVVIGDSVFGLDEARQFPRLRTVARFGTSISSIAWQELTQAGIKVSRTPSLSAKSVAEFILGTTIVLLREIPEQSAGLRGMPPSWRHIKTPGRDVRDVVFGVVGGGHIGLETAKLAKAFGAKVIIFNHRWPTGLVRAARLLECERATSLGQLLRVCDVISVNVELTDDTRHLFDNAAFETINRGVRRPVLINTSRGAVIDEVALLGAINNGWLRGAALDVWSTEGAVASETVSALRSHPLVLPTPHIAAFTEGTLDRTASKCAANVAAAIEFRLSEIDELVSN